MSKSIDIRNAKVGSKVVFDSGVAVVDRDSFDLKGLTGVVIKKDHYDAIHVKLDNYFSFLDEWDNCLIFDADSYFDNSDNPIAVTEKENEDFNYDKVRFTGKKYFYVNWDEQISKVIDNPYEFFTEGNGFESKDITMIQEMYIGQRKHVDEMMIDVEISRVK